MTNQSPPPQEPDSGLEPDKSLAWLAKLALPLIALIGVGLWYLISIIQPPPQKEVVMSTGSASGGFHAVSSRYKQALQKEGVRVRLINSKGSVENLARLKDPKSGVTAAFIQGGTGTDAPNDGLLSLGQMFFEPVWIFHQAKDTITTLSDLRGRKVAIGVVGSGTQLLATELLRRANVTKANATLLDYDKDKSVALLLKGEVDAVVLAFAIEAPALQELLRDPRLKLMSLGEADALVRLMPYLSKVTLPKGIFDLEKVIPAEPVHLVAPIASLVVRDDLHPSLVGLMAKAATHIHGGANLLQRPGDFPVPNDAVFKMSDDALRYYKSGQPFLQRILPFWLANFIERVLVLLIPLAGIAIPIVRGLPALYKWRVRQRLDFWYARLRRLETAMHNSQTGTISAAHRAEFETIDQAVRRLQVPKPFSEPYYNLRSHIDLVRGRVAGG